MFTGIHEHTIDKKGRTSLPARYRNALIDGAYISVGIDKNLVIYPIDFFEALGKEIGSFNMADPIARKYRRRMFSKAELIEFDAIKRLSLFDMLYSILIGIIDDLHTLTELCQSVRSDLDRLWVKVKCQNGSIRCACLQNQLSMSARSQLSLIHI